MNIIHFFRWMLCWDDEYFPICGENFTTSFFSDKQNFGFVVKGFPKNGGLALKEDIVCDPEQTFTAIIQQSILRMIYVTECKSNLCSIGFAR
jgi:hypothetical protein